jgi:mycothiol system anti-sigma-R factor
MIAVIVVSIICGVVANEVCEFSPWCARKIVHWSAFVRYADQGRAEMRAEELTALINDRPGNLFKLGTAACFAVSAVIVSTRRAVAREVERGRSLVLPVVSHDEVLARVYDYLDGALTERDCAIIRKHLDECMSCLREYGLEEAVKRLVTKHCGCDPVDADTRAAVLIRIRQVESELQTE